MNVLVLHGPNLNLLGEREPELYGPETLDEINTSIARRGRTAGANIRAFQSNHEGKLIDRLHEERDWMDGALLNAAAYTHTSVALRDAITAVARPTVEVHLTDPATREAFRHTSLLADVCIAVCKGRGAASYLDALDALIAHLTAPSAA